MSILDMVSDMAYEIKAAVRPHIGRQWSKTIVGSSTSGDGEFAIDEVAETAIECFLSRTGMQIAYYSEGRGLVKHGQPEYMLIVDPIDGTRPTMVGLEMGVVSIAVAPYGSDLLFGDVIEGCILELKGDRLYMARRGGQVTIRDADGPMDVQPTDLTDISHASWSYEVAGRPCLPIVEVLEGLIDKTSIKGGVFVFSSTAYSLTRLVSGQFDLVIDVGRRLLSDYPQIREQFLRAGMGRPFGLMPYDIAAATLIAETAGCVVTDAYGRPMNDIPLLDTDESNILSCVAASNPPLHDLALAEVEEGFRRFEERLALRLPISHSSGDGRGDGQNERRGGSC